MKVRLKECLLSFLFGLMPLLCIVGSTKAATLLPNSAAGPVTNVLDPNQLRVPHPTGTFESRCGGACVHDRTTGYFWESTPMPTPQTLSQARDHCKSLNNVDPYRPSSLTNNANAIGRGWDIPFIWEFATLPDPTLPSSSVPPNIFFNVQKDLYWTRSATEELARLFGSPFGGVGLVQFQSVNLLVWCMLGGSELCGVSSAYPCIIH
jgi:hypothetical protein